jgi:prepilin-type N-terminal cleavage/methylation domain-containing protein
LEIATFRSEMSFTPLADRNGSGATSIREHGQAAFTLIEVLISLGLLTLIAGSVSWALSQVNVSAASSRVYTCAEIIAQNEIDEFLSAAPYNPQFNQIPAALVTGTSNTPIVTPTNADNSITIYAEPANWTYANAAARTGATGFVAGDIGEIAYQSDNGTYWRLTATTPTWVSDNSLLVIKSNLPTDTPAGFIRTVTDLALNQTTNGVTQSLNARSLRVTLNYTFKGKAYTVTLNTIRVSDF